MTIILSSQGQQFLTVREQNSAECDACLKQLLCCCFKISIPEAVKKIGNHPVFGDVIVSQQITNEAHFLKCSGRVVNFLS